MNENKFKFVGLINTDMSFKSSTLSILLLYPGLLESDKILLFLLQNLSARK